MTCKGICKTRPSLHPVPRTHHVQNGSAGIVLVQCFVLGCQKSRRLGHHLLRSYQSCQQPENGSTGVWLVPFSRWTSWVIRLTWGFSRDPPSVFFLCFSAGGPCEQFWHRQIRPLFDVVHLEFPLLTTKSPPLQGALKNGFGEAVMVSDMPKPSKFPSLGRCQESFLWSHKGVDLAPHPVVGLVLRVADADRFPHAHGFKSLDPLFTVSKQGPCFTAIEEDGDDKRLAELVYA